MISREIYLGIGTCRFENESNNNESVNWLNVRFVALWNMTNDVMTTDIFQSWFWKERVWQRTHHAQQVKQSLKTSRVIPLSTKKSTERQQIVETSMNRHDEPTGECHKELHYTKTPSPLLIINNISSMEEGCLIHCELLPLVVIRGSYANKFVKRHSESLDEVFGP